MCGKAFIDWNTPTYDTCRLLSYSIDSYNEEKLVQDRGFKVNTKGAHGLYMRQDFKKTTFHCWAMA